MKLIYNLISIISFFLFVWSAIKANSQLSIYSFILTLTFVVLANLDKIKKFKASKDGLELEARDIIKKAEFTISELHKLAKLTAQTTLSLVKRSGRLGGYPEAEKETTKSNVLHLISQLGLSEQEQQELLKEWHEFTEIDYVFLILGNRLPTKWPDYEQKNWHEMREELRVSRPTPSELEELLKRNNSLTKQHKELIKDYEYYLNNKTHRRPEVWKNQREIQRKLKL